MSAGWETAYHVAPAVHAWRKRKDLSQAFRAATATPQALPLPAQIKAAPSYEALLAIHAENRLIWTPGLTALAAARKSELEAAS